LCGLAEPPRVVHPLAQLVTSCELADEVDAVEDAGVTVVDLAADVVGLVDPDDGGRALVAAAPCPAVEMTTRREPGRFIAAVRIAR